LSGHGVSTGGVTAEDLHSSVKKKVLILFSAILAKYPLPPS